MNGTERSLTVLLVVLFAAAVPAAFAGGAAEKAQPAGPVQLEFWHEWDQTNNPVAFAWAGEVVNAFESAHPNIRVNATAIPDQQYNTKFQTAVAGGTAPDGFMVRPGGWFKVYVDEGVVIPLDSYLDQGGWRQSFVESALRVGTYDGKTYCLPGGIRTVQVWYDKGLFGRQGLPVPKTSQDLRAAAARLKNGGIIPFALGNKEGWEAPLIYEYLLIRNGGYQDFQKAVARRGARFSDPVFVKAAQMLVDMNQAGWFPKGANGVDFGGMLGQFFGGQAAMAVFLNVMPGIASNAAPAGFDLSYFEFPTILDDPGVNSGMVGSIGGAWAVSAASRHQREMVEFLRFWTSKENMARLSAEAGWTMSVKDTVSKATASDLLWGFYMEIQNADHIIPFLDYALLPDTAEAVFLGLQQLLDGSKTPQQAMDAWEAAAAAEYGG